MRREMKRIGTNEAHAPTLPEVLAMVATAAPDMLAQIRDLLNGRATGKEADSCRLVTFSEAARLLNISRTSIWRLVRAGHLKPATLLTARRLRESDLRNLVSRVA